MEFTSCHRWRTTSAQDCGTHWFGGPDFAIEIVSPDDRTLDKLDFYAAVGTRELLGIDRDPRQLTLYRLSRDREPNPKLVPVALSTFAQPVTIAAETLPLSITLQADPAAICLGHTDGTLIRDIPIKKR